MPEVIDEDAPMALRSSKSQGLKDRKKKRRNFDIIDGDDDEYFKLLEAGDLDEATGRKKRVKDAEEAGREHQLKTKRLSRSPVSVRN